jgi:hypothetical protein
MSDQTKDLDPGSIWRDQPQEKLSVNQEQMMKRRTGELYSITRWEILMSIVAALLPVAVVAWRLPGPHEGLLEFGFGAVAAWAAICLYCFRNRIWGSSRPDAVAATGLDYYRTALERRRNHLRNGWLWYGPLSLASIILIAVLWGKVNIAFQPLRKVLPLIAVLALWTAFGLWRRRLQANQIQREIDEMAQLHADR